MAAMAQRDQEARTVQVNREKLIETLESNRVKHLAEYTEAMAGYKSSLLAKIEEAFTSAKQKLEDRYEKSKVRAAALTDEDITKQRDSFTLIEGISINMMVPRSYAKEYDAAIDMAKWDVRETLDLTHAEFTCFVRDQWNWSSDFMEVSALYKSMPF